MTEISTLSITGMTCATCSGAIEKLLNPMDGIQKTNVSLLMNQAVIEYNPTIIKIDDIIDEIEDIGFNATKVSSITTKTEEEKSDNESDRNHIKQHTINKNNIIIWTAQILTSCHDSRSYNDSYFYNIFTKELCGIIKIVFTPNVHQNETNHNQLSIYFDKTQILPIAITHKLQSKNINIQIKDIQLTKQYPKLVEQNQEDEEIIYSQLKKITFCIANINHYEYTFDLEPIQQKFGDLIYSINAKNILEDNLWIIVEYYDDQHISTSRQIYYYLCDEYGYDHITIIDAMSIERDSFRTTQIGIVRKIQNQFYLALVFGIPCFVIAMILPYIPWVHHNILMYNPIKGNDSVHIMGILLFLLSTPVQFFIGRTFYISAWHAFKHKTSNMSTLIVLGTTVAWIYSFIALTIGFVAHNNKDLHGASHFFETSATVITIVLLGKWLQAKAKFKTTDAIGMLMDMQPPFATLVTVDEYGEIMKEENVSTELVAVGDIISIKRSVNIPLDGTIVYGSTDIDESSITGESIPVSKHIGDHVISSSINCGSGKILVRVDAAKSDSVLSKIIDLMKHSQLNKPKQQQVADRISSYFVPVVVVIAVLTFIVWYILCKTTDINCNKNCEFFSILFAMAVMVIACPCALGLAVPTAVMVGTGVATKYGTLIKGGNILEIAHHLDIIVFDKTGTLTFGKPRVVNFVPFDKDANTDSIQRLLYYLGCAELHSEHPLGKAMLLYCEEKLRENHSFELKQPIEFEAIPGKGIKANVDGHNVCIGNYKWFFSSSRHSLTNEIELPDNITSIQHIKDILNKRNKLGIVSLLIAIDGKLEAYICLFDAPRASAKHIIDILKNKFKIKCLMLTGDNRNTAIAVAKAVGIEEYNVISNVLPQDKHQVIKELQTGCIDVNNKEQMAAKSISFTASKLITISMQTIDIDNEELDYVYKVGMVGDGINDAAALSQADLGIAIGSNGTDIAIEAADVILMNDNLFNIPMLIDLSSTIMRRIYLNFLWAFGFNCLGIPIAAGVLYPSFEIRLPPEIAAIAMGLSSLCVLISSIALKSYRSPYQNEHIIKQNTNTKNENICGCALESEHSLFKVDDYSDGVCQCEDKCVCCDLEVSSCDHELVTYSL